MFTKIDQFWLKKPKFWQILNFKQMLTLKNQNFDKNWPILTQNTKILTKIDFCSTKKLPWWWHYWNCRYSITISNVGWLRRPFRVRSTLPNAKSGPLPSFYGKSALWVTYFLFFKWRFSFVITRARIYMHL